MNISSLSFPDESLLFAFCDFRQNYVLCDVQSLSGEILEYRCDMRSLSLEIASFLVQSLFPLVERDIAYFPGSTFHLEFRLV
ncbi:hypothetical protein [Nostoc sp. CCY 9925]|uniref:hypothetical protein n=1 Tax=Nostoc sp. CCY 9925 TaxID=3103865 RepID=UPI0039C6D226